MAITVDVNNVSVEDKGKYKIAKVSFTRDGKENTTNVMSFGDGADVFLTLVAEKRGRFEVTLKQNGKYWNWVAVKKVSADVAPSSSVSTPQHNTSSRSFETAEERAERQVLIVRQSALDRAVGTLSVGAKVPPKREDVTDLAQYYADWVFNKPQGRNILPVGTSGVIDIEDDIPF